MYTEDTIQYKLSDLREILTKEDTAWELMESIAYHAHIAGSLSVGGVGLNLSKEERAEQYVISKGLKL